MVRHLPTLLLVDDDPGLLRNGKRDLGGAYRVLTAASLEEARERWRDDATISVAIVDLRLGGGASGLDLLRAWSVERPHVRLGLYSGHLSLTAVAEAIAAGARVIATKYHRWRQVAKLLEATDHGVRVLEEDTASSPSGGAGSSEVAERQEPTGPLSLVEMSRRHARAVRELNQGNMTKTARDLGCSRTFLYDLLKASKDEPTPYVPA